MNSRFKICPVILLLLFILSCGSPSSHQPGSSAPLATDTNKHKASAPKNKTDDSIAIESLYPPPDTLADKTPGRFRVVALSTVEPEGNTDNFKYAATIRVAGADKWHGKIAAYGALKSVWLAPSRWIGGADMATDGGCVLDIFPPGHDRKGCYMHYHAEYGCAGCAYSSAAPYFLKAREPDDSTIYDSTIRIKKISSKIITYALPEKNGVLTQGVVLFDDSYPYFRHLELALPANQSEMINFLMKYYLKKIRDN